MTKADKCVIVLTVILSILFYMIFNSAVFTENPQRVVIYVDGSEYASYKLNEITDVKTVRVETEFGVNTVEITNSGVRVVDASCPDKLDVHSGEISKAGQMLVCIPNHFSVRMYGKASDVDKVTY